MSLPIRKEYTVISLNFTYLNASVCLKTRFATSQISIENTLSLTAKINHPNVLKVISQSINYTVSIKN